MFKFIKSTLFLLGVFGASPLCLATDYDFTKNNPEEEAEAQAIRQEFASWLRMKVLDAPIRIGVGNANVPIATLIGMLTHQVNQIAAASFGGQGWHWGPNVGIPDTNSTVTINGNVYTIRLYKS